MAGVGAAFSHRAFDVLREAGLAAGASRVPPTVRFRRLHHPFASEGAVHGVTGASGLRDFVVSGLWWAEIMCASGPGLCPRSPV